MLFDKNLPAFYLNAGRRETIMQSLLMYDRFVLYYGKSGGGAKPPG